VKRRTFPSSCQARQVGQLVGSIWPCSSGTECATVAEVNYFSSILVKGAGHMDLVKRYAEIVTLVKSRKPRAIPEIS
jgi:hypothetical protein